MSFWLIGYGELLWDRTITAFVPMSVIQVKKGTPIHADLLDKYRFMSELEVDVQMAELTALGCTYCKKKEYACEQIRRDG
jgi:hypothetical protein